MLRVGVIGAGNISRMHLDSFGKNVDAELVAVSDINEQLVKERAEAYGVKTYYTDYKKNIEDESIDASLNELVYDYLRCNLLENPFVMEKRCEESEDILKIWDNEYAAQLVSDEYTFFVRFIPNDGDSKAYIFEYVNDILYTHLEPMKFPAPSTIDCEAAVSYVKHLDSYKNPRITYLDDVEEECWNLFKAYASYVGVEFGDGIDYTIAKEISEKIMSLVERTFGVDFPLSKGG